ncbi:hydrolase CocE/NonD family protein [Aspergillus pseudoustus]|uniref:Hydrolase CocE/NonD family protein n=1 Tax=Aspergillus pseudoustus TaxID=1810923 RepID=A0ABR4K312_9EURO
MRAGDIEIAFHDKQDKARGNRFYPGFKPGVEILKKGTTVIEGALALPCDIVKERDVPVKLRDGTAIYIDILRPDGYKAKMPALIAWSPFGKNGGLIRNGISRAPWRRGIPQRSVSGLEVFEGQDPAYWCNHGYAIVHPDVRGTWMSEGNMMMNNVQEGRDGYDLVEWVAQQEWSNKRVSFAGNSWLSQSQWFIAAEQPPHLTCIAPYEGWNDMYNDTTNRGGIPDPGFQAVPMMKACAGNNLIEDVGRMSRQYPMWNEYYEQRRARLDRITVPIYATASWTNFLHTRGTFRGFIESGSKDKWLRVHNSNEWPDIYYPQNVEDYRKFYDHYMKDESNGWEFTPRVRVSILNPGHKDVVNRPEPTFPLLAQQSVKMYLSTNSLELSWGRSLDEKASVLQFSAKDEIARFTHTFTQRMELTGFFKLKLFVSSPTNADDIDIFCKTSKLSATDELLESCCIDVGYLSPDPEAERAELARRQKEKDPSIDCVWYAEGTTGRQRVSHRELDTEISTPHWPRYTHSNYQPLKAGEIVPVEIELWPLGMIWEAGEKLQLSIAGFNLRPEGISILPPAPTLNEEGSSIAIHSGGEYDSHLLVPFIPGP